MLPLDVTKEGSVAALADRFHEKPVDVVINNAGVHFRKWSVPERVSFADWEVTLQVNTLGPPACRSPCATALLVRAVASW